MTETKHALVRDVFELADTEQIFYEFSCSLSATASLPGRLYVTENYVCFSATLLGIESKKKIEIEHIKKLRKDKQLMIFDSSIVIELADECSCQEKTMTFNSFENRDEVLECITSIW